MEFDIYNIIEKLKEKRKSFVSEADFQFSLAWEIQTLYPDAKILLEYPLDFDKSMHLDILVILNNKWIPIELKHKTEIHGAIDLGAYSYIKDISRIESIRKNKADKFHKGYTIMLTDFINYRLFPKKKDVGYWDFNLKDGRIIEENTELSFPKNYKIAKKHPSIKIISEYSIKWDIYSNKNDNNEEEIWYMLINEIV